jgi:hypothetical protein
VGLTTGDTFSSKFTRPSTERIAERTWDGSRSEEKSRPVSRATGSDDLPRAIGSRLVFDSWR